MKKKIKEIDSFEIIKGIYTNIRVLFLIFIIFFGIISLVYYFYYSMVNRVEHRAYANISLSPELKLNLNEIASYLDSDFQTPKINMSELEIAKVTENITNDISQEVIFSLLLRKLENDKVLNSKINISYTTERFVKEIGVLNSMVLISFSSTRVDQKEFVTEVTSILDNISIELVRFLNNKILIKNNKNIKTLKSNIKFVKEKVKYLENEKPITQSNKADKQLNRTLEKLIGNNEVLKKQLSTIIDVTSLNNYLTDSLTTILDLKSLQNYLHSLEYYLVQEESNINLETFNLSSDNILDTYFKKENLISEDTLNIKHYFFIIITYVTLFFLLTAIIYYFNILRKQ